ncbi:hypothetical protein LshimejAT787_0900070 [Lyophyllum shimeji]|uniref:Uncharacterized protein n=1 Tax=Lyophyllum shimeji TaxID=47721 RepID=A0A9P3PQH3_LYOSH|nr:hypothetical protein LshimejAT787_0900070 [Lyophyllum shimeji]
MRSDVVFGPCDLPPYLDDRRTLHRDRTLHPHAVPKLPVVQAHTTITTTKIEQAPFSQIRRHTLTSVPHLH